MSTSRLETIEIETAPSPSAIASATSFSHCAATRRGVETSARSRMMVRPRRGASASGGAFSGASTDQQTRRGVPRSP